MAGLPSLLEALPLNDAANVKTEPSDATLHPDKVHGTTHDSVRDDVFHTPLQNPDIATDHSRPCTPPPPLKPYFNVEAESTPGNISQLGFDVALTPKKTKTRAFGESLYTQAFETALDVVLLHEAYLFSEDELKIFDAYRGLSYEGRFLYVRFFLRKRAAWFRVDKIGYENDISNVERTCQELWMNPSQLAEDQECISELSEYLALLSLDELKLLGKQFSCKGTTKDKLIGSLLTLSKYQSGLQRSGSLGLDVSASGKPAPRANAILTRTKAMLGQLIKLSEGPVSLFHRLHIVFYRSSEYNEKSLTTLILARISRRNFPVYIVDRKSNIFSDRASLLEYESALKLKFEVDEIMEFRTTLQGLERVMQVFEVIYEPWQMVVLQEQDSMALQETREASPLQDDRHGKRTSASTYYARRFTAAWIWTKIIYQAAIVLAKRHEYRKEHELWTTLLSQKVFRIGKRGEWYDRKALIEQHYAPTFVGPLTEAVKRSSKRMARETCMSGLQDPDTHQIYHNALQRRIVRLETDLNFTKREKHDFTHIVLRKPAQRVMRGVRLDDKMTGKHSVWRGSESAEAEVGVEELCLEQYGREGWKGFHSENSIVTTLFATLFFDILFLPIPGVFQTPFQTAPLDLASDAFYPARASEINHRLAHIRNGGAADLICAVDGAHRARETWCVGLKWTYTRADLLEIVECLGGDALASLLRLFAEEYGHRVGGVGDLCLWHHGRRECMFVEVKGPGDRLSETQVAWLDQMALAGIRVELCHVVEEHGAPDRKVTLRGLDAKNKRQKR